MGVDRSQAWAASSGRGGTRTVSAAAERAGSAPGKRVLVPTWARCSPHPVECVRSWGAFVHQPAVPRKLGNLANTKEVPPDWVSPAGLSGQLPTKNADSLEEEPASSGPLHLGGTQGSLSGYPGLLWGDSQAGELLPSSLLLCLSQHRDAGSVELSGWTSGWTLTVSAVAQRRVSEWTRGGCASSRHLGREGRALVAACW